MAKRYKSKRANKKSLITKISDVIDHTPKIVLWLNIMSSFINEYDFEGLNFWYFLKPIYK